MTVKGLKEALSEFPDDAEVRIEAWYEIDSCDLPAPELRMITTRPLRVAAWRDTTFIITEQP